jgi:hypothetical protein
LDSVACHKINPSGGHGKLLDNNFALDGFIKKNPDGPEYITIVFS